MYRCAEGRFWGAADQFSKRSATRSTVLLTDVEAPDDKMPLMLFAMEGFSATQRTFMLSVCRKRLRRE